MQDDLSALKKAALDVASHSSVSDHVEDIILEADRDDEGDDFLRVIVHFRNLDTVDDERMEELLYALERKIIDLDDRFPSIRFADAA